MTKQELEVTALWTRLADPYDECDPIALISSEFDRVRRETTESIKPVFERIANQQARMIVFWTYEAAANEYARMLDINRQEARQALDSILEREKQDV